MTQLEAEVKQLQDLKVKVEDMEGRPISDGEFSKRFLKFSATTWSKIQSGTYNGNEANIISSAKQSIEELEAILPNIEQAATVSKKFVRTTLAKAAISSVARARAGVDSRKVVVILAPTGYGKSAIGHYLESRGALMVEGRQAWRSSYRAFCSDICKAAGRKVSPSLPEYRLEDEMISALSTKDGVLYIDEANTMSASCANAIKFIANQTGYTVVIAAIPEMWDKFLNGSKNEVAQLVNRCQPVLRAGQIHESDVAPFLSKNGLSGKIDLGGGVAFDIDKDPDAKRYVKKITKAANEFGGFRTVIAISNRLDEFGVWTEVDLDREIEYHHKNIIASGIGR